MATLTRSRISIRIQDFDGDVGQVTFDGDPFTSGTYTADLSAATAIRAAIDAITIGTIIGTDIVSTGSYDQPVVGPTDYQAQTRTQWVVEMMDNVTGGTYTARIPTAGGSGLTATVVNGVTTLDLGSTEGAALKSAIEGFVLINGHAVTVTTVYLRDNSK